MQNQQYWLYSIKLSFYKYLRALIANNLQTKNTSQITKSHALKTILNSES